jgi:hypothetical protein
MNWLHRLSTSPAPKASSTRSSASILNDRSQATRSYAVAGVLPASFRRKLTSDIQPNCTSDTHLQKGFGTTDGRRARAPQVRGCQLRTLSGFAALGVRL